MVGGIGFHIQEEMAMTNKTFDPTKPVQTRDGRKARILATDLCGKNGETIAAAIHRVDFQGCEILSAFFDDGSSSRGPRSDDLVNVPERVTKWCNIYGPRYYGSRIDADKCAITGRVAVAELIFEEDKLVDVIKHDVGEK